MNLVSLAYAVCTAACKPNSTQFKKEIEYMSVCNTAVAESDLSLLETITLSAITAPPRLQDMPDVWLDEHAARAFNSVPHLSYEPQRVLKKYCMSNGMNELALIGHDKLALFRSVQILEVVIVQLITEHARFLCKDGALNVLYCHNAHRENLFFSIRGPWDLREASQGEWLIHSTMARDYKFNPGDLVFTEKAA